MSTEDRTRIIGNVAVSALYIAAFLLLFTAIWSSVHRWEYAATGVLVLVTAGFVAVGRSGNRA